MLASVSANVFQKKMGHRGLSPLYITLGAYLVLTLISLPLLSLLNFDALRSAFWVNIVLAASLDMAGTLLLVMSLSKTDLSVFGPLNAYKVVFSALLALIFLGEVPSWQGGTGIFIILLGSVMLFPPQNGGRNRLLELLIKRGVQLRFLSILLFSIGTLPLKNAVIIGGPLATTLFWCLFGLPLAGLAYRLFRQQSFPVVWQAHASRYPDFIGLGVLIFIMQMTTMMLLEGMLIAYALALFQLSMMLQVFLGYRLFQEQHLARRLVACTIMILGCLLVLTT
ncbi:Permeases of the drug/metabolite transporter (DMT) superfamily [Methylophaga frappieri]|uniref:Permeases of the drug/metabolite transporter (DMT) superfamily n=2 Tax=Methylophaga frappieri (strain ATCC BAA-2434 / DSM 25690 / JAM7) TaxID=754477 RepID=I1YHK3_METFJ|nr:Permeases of the drug/metabolite transporter (DMT) superfamily [Methylophaga frappieri]